MPSRKPTSKPSRFALYLRYSTLEQGDQQYSTIDTQRETNAAHIARLGGTIVSEYVDEGFTGTNFKRPGYRRMLQDAEAGLFDSVCVTYMSRLGRGDAFTIARHELERRGVSVTLSCETFADDISGYAAQTMTKLMDGMYPVMVRGWTETKMLRMLEQGYRVCGAVPFGYVSVVAGEAEPGKNPPKRLQIEPTQAGIVREAFNIFLSERCYRNVREYLISITGQEWSHDRLKLLLSNQQYRGRASWGEHENLNAHPAIIDADTFNTAQELTASLNTTGGKAALYANRSLKEGYYFRGRIYCACGSLMTCSWSTGRGGKYLYYLCQRHAKYAAPCENPQVSVHRLHEGVFGMIGTMAKSTWQTRQIVEEAAKHLPDTKGLERTLLALRRERASLAQSARTTEAALDFATAASLPGLMAKLNSLRASEATKASEVTSAEAELSKAYQSRPSVRELQETCSRFSEAWENLEEDEKERASALLIGRVDIKEYAAEVELRLIGGMFGTTANALEAQTPSLNESETGQDLRNRPLPVRKMVGLRDVSPLNFKPDRTQTRLILPESPSVVPVFRLTVPLTRRGRCAK